jgi:hypothetical protein
LGPAAPAGREIKAFYGRLEGFGGLDGMMAATDNDESPEALFEAGKRFYFSSRGSAADPSLALHYFERAARLGFSPAQRLLGICLLEGTICPKDLAMARYWLTSAAEKKDPQAAFTLALMHAKGQGVPKDWHVSYRLLSRPEVLALPEARELRRRLKEELIDLYPLMAEALRKEENIIRAGLSHHQKRFIQPFLSDSRPGDDRAEFEAWLDLNLGKASPKETLSILKASLAAYYRAMIIRHPAIPG